MKLDVTTSAIEMIKNIQKDSKEEITSLRINLAGFGWGGPSFGLVLDEQKENDEVFDIEGISFLVSGDLKQFEGFEVDYSNVFPTKGFNIAPLSFTGGSC